MAFCHFHVYQRLISLSASPRIAAVSPNPGERETNGRDHPKKDHRASRPAPADDGCDVPPGRLAAATTVGYVNDGLTLYFLCGPESQKAHNLARDNRVSLTVDHDVTDPMAITGLSMAAHAYPVTDSTEVAKPMQLLGQRYPEYASFPMPKPEEIRVFRVEPMVTSVLDYSKGFGHTDLVTGDHRQHRTSAEHEQRDHGPFLEQGYSGYPVRQP
jgi:hypothetical protein